MGQRRDAALVCAALEAGGHPRLPTYARHDLPYRPRQRGRLGRLQPNVPAAGLRRSMGRTESWLDNAVAESWFASLKVELVDRADWRTRAEARAAIFAWIAWYNRSRLHSTNGYLPPIEWEQQQATISPLLSAMAAWPRCPLPRGNSRLAQSACCG
jgi:transposase InsO family protein